VFKQMNAATSVLRLPSVKSRVALCRSSIYAAIKKGTFPAPIKLGERAVGWLESDVNRWLAERIQASGKEASV
jgi:prophage regulatory protein